jgi:hypothetical protein
MRNVPKLTWFLSVLALFLAGNLVFTACVKDVAEDELVEKQVQQDDKPVVWVTLPDGSKKYIQGKRVPIDEVDSKILEYMKSQVEKYKNNTTKSSKSIVNSKATFRECGGCTAQPTQYVYQNSMYYGIVGNFPSEGDIVWTSLFNLETGGWISFDMWSLPPYSTGCPTWGVAYTAGNTDNLLTAALINCGAGDEIFIPKL